MPGNGYKALGFVVWKGGTWYLRRRYGGAKRVGLAALATVGVAAAAATVIAQRRRNGSGAG